MGTTARRISDARKEIAAAAAIIGKFQAEIDVLQQTCDHTWRFNRQVNAHHVTNWYVTYKCSECDVEKTEVKQPVCSSCDQPLYAAFSDDQAAEERRRAHDREGLNNPPLAYRCPKCRGIHILWLCGD